MRIYNSYVLTLALLLLATTPVLIGLGQTALETFCAVYIIEALVVTELYVYLNARVRRQLQLVSVILFGSFLMIMAFNIIGMLG